MARKNIGTHVEKPNVTASKSKGKRNRHELKSKGKVPKVFVVLLSVFVVLLIAGLIYANWGKITGKKNPNAATVNGEAITLSDLDDYYNRLAPQAKAAITKDQLLDDMINKKILMKKANELGISVNQTEVDSYIDEFIGQAGITRDELKSRLLAQNISIDLLNSDIRQQLTLTKLYQQEIIDKANVTDEEIETYYVDNLAAFRKGEQVRVEHILICHNESLRCESNLSMEEALIKAKDIKAMVNSTNFESLAQTYSQDPSSDNGGDLGYFEKGAMVKPFEDSAFSLSIGNVSGVVETQYGFHLLKLLDKKQETVQKLEEVKEDIRQAILAQKQQASFKAYIDDLKAKANVIKYYNGTADSTE